MKNTQIRKYLENQEIKEHEKEMIEFVKSDFRNDEEFSVLDIGCATGNFINLIKENFPKAKGHGFDISKELILLAQNRKLNECDFVTADMLTYAPSQNFDLIIASGVLSIFDDFREPLLKWLDWMKQDGSLYMFGNFNSRNIDTIISFRNNQIGNSNWEGGLTSYSVETLNNFLTEEGYTAIFKRFNLKIDISEHEDPIRTFTKITQDGERIVMTGANIITELYFLKIKRST